MVLARDPQVLLLDEPLAGMGPEESERHRAAAAGAGARTMRCC